VRLSTDPVAVEGRRRELRRLLCGWCIAYPVLAYGMLGNDPNKMDSGDQFALSDDLQALGYSPRPRRHPFSHAHLMTFWHREAEWPEDIHGRKPYRGIPLAHDPDLMTSYEE
jgi:hypothetical protein